MDIQIMMMKKWNGKKMIKARKHSCFFYVENFDELYHILYCKIIFLWYTNFVKKEQLLKILKVAIVSTIIMLVAEAIFDIPAVVNWFSNLITGSSGIWVWIVIWLIMFLQVTILNIPAYVILSASVSIGIETLSITYILVVISAYMVGCILAYWLGRWFGIKAVKWCAGSEEDYNKWSDVLNKKGKWWYFATVVFPFFPDDLLCLVAGSVKFNFEFYAVANLIGRTIGLVTMLLTLKLIGNISGNFPIMLIVWAAALVAELVVFIVLKIKMKKEQNAVKPKQQNAEPIAEQQNVEAKTK